MRKTDLEAGIEHLLRVEDLASGFRVSYGTIYRWAKGPYFPQSVRLGNRLRRWAPETVARYVAQTGAAWRTPRLA
jgi:predicted DNA-binding transcriptional regulator AlpA